MIDEQELLYFNGIDGDRGAYDLPPMTAKDLAQIIEGEELPENLNELRFRYQQRTARHLGVKEGVNVKRLDESGWGIIFAHDADETVKEALDELIELRQEQAGDHFRFYAGADGYRSGESKNNFLARHGAGPGPADPEKVPYYLLIVGSPEAIPYRFQTQLDVQYAVGRIHFDTPQEYANYARTVVAAETGQIRLPRQVTFFGTANSDDRATRLSAQHLVSPLYIQLRDSVPDWQFSEVVREEATKTQLSRLLGGDQTPALLFTASHGMSFGVESPRQLPHQGALLCQDWPGPQEWQKAIPQDFYFAADDLGSEADLQGLIAFFFACFGAGTPQFDDFAQQAFHDQRAEIAPHDFLARLPTAMLSHGRGGALATVGHVERAWGYSFMWPGAGAQTTAFESVLRGLLSGYPVGYATEYLNERYAELSTVLSDELEEVQFGKMADPYELSGMWTANNDARGYAIIGDPAVRLPVVDSDDPQVKRPVVEVQPVEVISKEEVEVGEEETSEEFVAPGDESLLEPTPEGMVDLKTIIVTTYAGGAAGDTPKSVAARTRLDLDGDMDTFVEPHADEKLLSLHQSMVHEAVAARLAYLQLGFQPDVNQKAT